jgi:hypothetical protein
MEFTVTTITYQYNEDQKILKFNIKDNDALETVKVFKENDYILVLDISGSMSGTPFRQAMESMFDIISSLKEQMQNNIYVVTFNDVVKIYELHNMNMDDIKNHLTRKISCGCSTDFIELFINLKRLVAKIKNDTYMTVFTDGQDTSDGTREKSKLKGHINSFNSEIQRKKNNENIDTVLHTIGFSSDHDVQTLTTITLAGTKQGTFGYVKESKDIKLRSQEVSNLILSECGDSVKAKVISDNTVENLNLIQSDNGDYVAYKLYNNNFNTSKLLVTKGKNTKELVPNNVTANLSELDGSSVVDAIIDSITTKIINLASKITNDKKQLQVLRVDVDDCDKMLDELRLKVMKMKPIIKKKLMPQILESKDLISETYKTLAEASIRTLSIDKIATLNNLAYKNITKKSLEKKLNKRADTNVSLFEKNEKDIEKIVQNINFESLSKNDFDGVCALSCNNWIEALENGDCMCLSLDISRTQAAIADPAQVNIKNIYGTILTAESFLDSIEYSVRSSTESNAHGGFNPKASGSIVLGEGRENITGVLPLYINKEHWQVAKRKMKPIMGWMTTLDVLGYSYSQVKTIPFAVLAHLLMRLKENDNEFNRKLYKYVSETCCQIMKDASSESTNIDHIKMSDEITNIYNNYLTNPLVRLVDSVANNKIFLAQVHIAKLLGYITEMSTDDNKLFARYLLEEEYRRYQPKTLLSENNQLTDQVLIKLIGIDLYNYVELAVKEFSEYQHKLLQFENSNKTNTYYLDKFRVIMKQNDIDITNDTNSTIAKKENNNSIEYPSYGSLKIEDFDISTLRETEFGVDYVKLMENVFDKFIVPIQLLLSEKTVHNLEDLELQTFRQKLAFLIQNLYDHKNATRRESIESNRYVYMYDKHDADKYLKDIYLRIVTEEKNNKFNLVLASINSKKSNDAVNVFLNTTSVHEAAGALYGTYLGRIEFMDFVRGLQNRDIHIPLFMEKLKMLISGQFMGIKLVMDLCLDWDPCKKNTYRLCMSGSKYDNSKEMLNIFSSKFAWKYL